MPREFCREEHRNHDGSTSDQGESEPALRRSMRGFRACDCTLRNCRRGGIEKGLNLVDGPALGRIATKAILRNLAEGVGERCGNFWVLLLLVPNRRPLGKCFHQNHTERPYVRC